MGEGFERMSYSVEEHLNQSQWSLVGLSRMPIYIFPDVLLALG